MFATNFSNEEESPRMRQSTEEEKMAYTITAVEQARSSYRLRNAIVNHANEKSTRTNNNKPQLDFHKKDNEKMRPNQQQIKET